MEELFGRYLSGEEIILPKPLLATSEFNLGIEITLIGLGENNYIIGKPKTGKSQFASYIISQVINTPSEKLYKCDKEILTILIDTEQGLGQINQLYIQNVFKGKSIDELKQQNKINEYKIYSVKNESDKLKAVINIISELKREYFNKHLFIVIDNLTTLVKNINDPSDQTIDTLIQLRENNTMLLLLHALHKNHSEDTEAIGHIGSQAKRNAAITLNSKKCKDGVYQLEFQNSRYHDDTNQIVLEFTQIKDDEIYYFEEFELKHNCEIQKKQKTRNEIKNEIKLFIDKILIQTNNGDEKRLRKSIVIEIMKLFDYKKTTAYNYVDSLIEDKIYLIDNDEMSFYPPF